MFRLLIRPTTQSIERGSTSQWFLRWLLLCIIMVAALEWGLHRLEHPDPDQHKHCPLCKLVYKADSPPPALPAAPLPLLVDVQLFRVPRITVVPEKPVAFSFLLRGPPELFRAFNLHLLG